ncbi:MAG: 50S ribosomal protein L2 [Planctomycetota bacterium]|nr:50S ribosomal protein L2 [Planctomycetota bacterium]MDA0932884.1 50S ribosomal protein L2 [Planctomycetota bacterium]MDA1221146.1 50S ribosomal protein L2 [Planctomycetota bacterium]
MPIKVYKPTSAGRRNASVLDFSHLTKKRPEKSLVERISRKGGRNHHGHITSRFRGGGARKLYRIVDFKRNKDGVPGKVAALEYDPNRNADIALIHYADGEKRYILAAKGLAVGARVISGERVEPDVGNAMPLSAIPLGLQVHNVELQPGKGGQIARSAGISAQLMARDGDYAVLVMPSGELRKVHVRCRATVGEVGNADYQNVRWGKAGRLRHKGRRPHNRGTSMNPVAHPMGGGEGRTGGGRHPCSPWGKPAKGGKSRRGKARSNQFILRRRKPGKHSGGK